MNEGDCELKDMIKVCGNTYFQDNTNIKIDDEDQLLQNEGVVIEERYVIFNYKVNLQGKNLNQITIESDYMMNYNDHGVNRIFSALLDNPKSYDLNFNKRIITIEL